MFNIYFNGDLIPNGDLFAENLTEKETLEKLQEYITTDRGIVLDELAETIDFLRRFSNESVSWVEIDDICDKIKSLDNEKLLNRYEITYSDDENAKISAYDFIRERGIEI